MGMFANLQKPLDLSLKRDPWKAAEEKSMRIINAPTHINFRAKPNYLGMLNKPMYRGVGGAVAGAALGGKALGWSGALLGAALGGVGAAFGPKVWRNK